jgi:carbon monoxide dehydrogenase subunit G
VTASPAAWAALGDPERLAAALPGCRTVTRAAGGDGALHVVTELAVASARGLWAGTVVPVDADAVRVRGSGAPGRVDLVVRADPARTTLTVEGTVEGPLGSVGSAVLAAALRQTARELLAAVVAPPAPTAASAAPTAASAGSAAPVTVGSSPAGATVQASRRRSWRRVAGAAALGAAVVVGRRRVQRRSR